MNVKKMLETALTRVKDDPLFFVNNSETILALVEALKAQSQDQANRFGAELGTALDSGVLVANENGTYHLESIIPGVEPVEERLTGFEEPRVVHEILS